MESAKKARTHETHKKKTQPQSCRMGNGAQVEVSDLADQYVSEGEVEKAPHHVDSRRGKSLTGRLSERALKGMPHQPTDKVGNCIGKKRAAKEIRDIVQPFHRESSLSVQNVDNDQSCLRAVGSEWHNVLLERM